MGNLETISRLIEKSGLRKTGTGLSMFAGIVFLRYKDKLSDAGFVECFMYLILALFAANALEHYVKAKYSTKEVKPDDPAVQP